MLAHGLPRDTQATLLLCSHFGQFSTHEAQPLTLSEYNRLVGWLVKHQMRPADLLEKDGQAKLDSEVGLNPARLLTLLKRGVTLGLTVEKWIGQGLWIVSRGDPSYPQRLKECLRHQAPPVVYGVGDQSLLNRGGLAIVGSRNVDEDGMDYTRRVAQACVQSAMQVVSGGARGVDQTAMLAALETGGTVVGVLADSLSKASLSGKYRRYVVQNQLTLISCYDPDAGFSVGNAMGRNKYVYALADYGLVVSSDLEKGGTWAGAIEALEQYPLIPVFVRAGIALPGNQALLQKGAFSFPEPPWPSLKTLLSDSVSHPEARSPSTPTSPHATAVSDLETVARPAAEMPKPVAPVSAPTEIYDLVLPVLCHHLQHPLDKKTLVSQLNAHSENVTESQVSKWLERAIADGMINKQKIKRRIVYALAKHQDLTENSERQLSIVN